MDPINYKTDVQTPVASFVEGLGVGSAVYDMQAKRAAEQKQALQQQAMGAELAKLSENPTTQGIIQASIKYPSLSESLTRAHAMLSPEESQAKLDRIIPVYAAINSGRNDVAAKLLNEAADAQENSGDKDGAAQNRTYAKLVVDHPETAKITAGLLVSSLAGPEKFGQLFAQTSAEARANAKAPAELSEANSKASKAAVDAKFAESEAVQNLAKTGWDINKIQNDIEISRDNTRIANARLIQDKTENALKKEELQAKIDKMVTDRDAALNEKVASVESARSSIDNMLNTGAKLLEHPGLSSAVGSADGIIPSFMPNTVDFEALLKTFDSQKFLAQLPAMKSLGALSEKEGDKLQASLSPTALRQSEPAFRKNVSEAIRLMNIARENLAVKYGVPDTTPDTPAATEALDSRPYMRHADQGAAAPAGDGWSIRPIGNP